MPIGLACKKAKCGISAKSEGKKSPLRKAKYDLNVSSF
jgi:hypothetical protein